MIIGREKIKQLRTTVQWAAEDFCTDCEFNEFEFEILEVYRPQSRQNFLYSIGRRGIPNERRVTWTLKSFHTLALAMDLRPINCGHEDLTYIAMKY